MKFVALRELCMHEAAARVDRFLSLPDTRPGVVATPTWTGSWRTASEIG